MQDNISSNMNLEILKKLISENYLNVSEAIWLNETSKNQFDFSRVDLNSEQIVEELLGFLNSKLIEVDVQSIEDNLFIFSIMQKLGDSIHFNSNYLSEDDDGEDEDDDGEDDPTGFYSKRELTKLRKIEDQLCKIGHEELLNQLLMLIDTKYSKVYNGFNKLEFQRAKSKFWKKIGYNDYGYYILSDEAKKFIDDIYSAAESEVIRRTAKKELESLPDVINNFKFWVNTYNYKPNKTNLKQFLKENEIKLSNPNVDKILYIIK